VVSHHIGGESTHVLVLAFFNASCAAWISI
jgi:hypothetical protein